MSEDDIIYRSSRRLKIGELQRYIITFEPEGDSPFLGSLWLKVRNAESVAMRAAFLRGPYIAYVDVTPMEYQMDKPTFVTLDQPKFEPNLSPSQSFSCELSLHMIKKKYSWTVDVVSQILFSSTTDVAFELMIGLNKECLSRHIDKLGSFDKRLIVNSQDTVDLWNLPMPIKGKPVHLVVLTHGLHSNTGADLHYMKERLDALNTADEQLIVRGFHGNSCKTERGVKYLGSRLGEYIVQELHSEDVKKISFIGHSLGGLVQTFAIAYIQVNFPWFFERVQPINFITMASPLLGIVTDNPAYVKAALSFGFVGRTGQDLGLESIKGEEPLLKLLPTGPTHKILRSFQKRTLYANAINDGIVPLYTAALLYLDWKGLNTVSNIKYHNAQSANGSSHEESTGKIPCEDQDIMISTTKSLINPFQKAINLLTPNASADKSPVQIENRGNVFPKTSMIESAASILLPPVPPLKLITDPASREDVIIHDRVYTEADIPPKTVKKRTFMQNLDPLAKFEELEEDIAREWHKGMAWRKVLVKLEPDAHNNMIVRRRYVNAFGWPVVEHMVINHFCGNDSSIRQCESDDSDELENLEEINSLADRETLQRDNAEMDLGEESMLNHWVNKQSEETIFDIGATGMMTNFNDLLDNFCNWSMATNFEVPPTTENAATQVVEESDINPQDSYIESTYLR